MNLLLPIWIFHLLFEGTTSVLPYTINRVEWRIQSYVNHLDSLRNIELVELESTIADIKNSTVGQKTYILRIADLIRNSLDPYFFTGRLRHNLSYKGTEGELKDRLQELESRISKINVEIQNLEILGILKPGFTIERSRDQSPIQEIAFYSFKDSMKIAEIGAGYGEFSLLIYNIFHFDQVWINEIDNAKLDHIKKRIANQPGLHLVKGRKKTTRLEFSEFDIIIVRKSFHHFSFIDKMLESITQSLRADGKLYLLEPIIKSGEYVCPQALSKSEILNHLRVNSFQVTQELELPGYIVLECIKRT